ncbi:amidase family protein [Zeaxanthinibacter enoshimensis]|uniref:Amidase n=1 Tax=Zeaxanthinibacter enoshimensis TaxID=392009 RepID=A0A4R6TTV9_9FLAO|nr:amidase family protein [Zeaxanthinibacter enoshimensis]TDQ33369.1 amidase [Zeaxanthinibacter enoshimensis]
MRYIIPLAILLLLSCQAEQKFEIAPWVPYDESGILQANADHENTRLRYKRIQAKVLDKNDLWAVISPQLQGFSEERYQELKPLIFEQDILSIQDKVESGQLTYEALAQWYLYRIVRYENDPETALNAIIAINPEVVAQARERDAERTADRHPVFGIPILVKDNINTSGMATTAGADALKNNFAPDAHIIRKFREHGGLVLGKTNLSEWANFFCSDCPNGYSAMGGQTLNPYGPRQFDTGGSSSGSGVAMAANYAAATIGTETSGSILSPASKNSVVGLKPTVGLLSRSGIVPISSTLDTPGPITKHVVDNAILLSALTGEDRDDPVTLEKSSPKQYWKDLREADLSSFRLGVNKEFLKDSIYAETVQKLEAAGVTTIAFEPIEADLTDFGRVLSADMQTDLAHYLKNFSGDSVRFQSAAEIERYNEADSVIRMPYGQERFHSVSAEDLDSTALADLKQRLNQEAVRYFTTPMDTHKLDAVLSINNYSAGYAAMAHFPCLTIPMGYSTDGEPIGLTFIGKPFEEEKLLKMAYDFERNFNNRKPPAVYD